MTSTLFVEEIKGRTTGTNANKVIVPSGQTLEVPTVTGNPSFTGGLKVNTVQDTTGTTAMTIGSSGVVSKPATPRLSVWLYTGMTIATATYTKVQLNGTDLISGGMTGFTHANTYSKFTASTAGDYFVSGSMRWYTNSGIAGSRLNIYKNGSMVMESFSNSLAYYEQLHCSTIITLAANDYIELVVYQASGGDVSLAAGKYVNMKAFLVA